MDISDSSLDCCFPQLVASLAGGGGGDGGKIGPAGVVGHEGSWAPDGLTYYVGDTSRRSYHAVDVVDPTKPKYIATFDMKTVGLRSHGLSISDDGNRAYVVTPGSTPSADLLNPAVAPVN